MSELQLREIFEENSVSNMKNQATEAGIRQAELCPVKPILPLSSLDITSELSDAT